jgi:hypothetical protein
MTTAFVATSARFTICVVSMLRNAYSCLGILYGRRQMSGAVRVVRRMLSLAYAYSSPVAALLAFLCHYAFVGFLALVE